ncbi:histidine kinase, partial [Citrobacter sp. AAK_AS5]
MAEGVALHEIVCNAQGEPVDYRLLDVNPAYGRQTGLLPEQARGRRASELYGISEPPYLKEWTEVARTGKPRMFETFFSPL